MSVADEASVRSDLQLRLAALGVDELRVLDRIAERLVMGAGQYGRLDVQSDPREWIKEASEELLDGCVYLACRSLRKVVK